MGLFCNTFRLAVASALIFPPNINTAANAAVMLAPAGISETETGRRAAAEKFLKKYEYKPDRTSIPVEMHAAVESQLDISIVISELEKLHAAYAVTAEETLELRTEAFLEKLKRLYFQIPCKIREKENLRFYLEQLRTLKKDRAAIQEQICVADDLSDERSLAMLNKSAIAINRLILKTQLKIAGMFLRGASGLRMPVMRRNAARFTLRGALYTAAELEYELLFAEMRSRTSGRLESVKTTDLAGSVERTYSLADFDICILSAQKDVPATVTIRQKRWINAQTVLKSIDKDIRLGNIAQAQSDTAMLIELYREERVYTAIIKLLRSIQNELETAVTEKTFTAIKTLQEIIKHPKHAVWSDVAFEGLDKAFRSQVHTIESYQNELNRIDRYKTVLNFFNEKLKFARERGALSARDRMMIAKKIAFLRDAWAHRGSVYPKQFVEQCLQPIEAQITGGGYWAAQETISGAIRRLEQRQADIHRIIEQVQKRAAALYAQRGDEDNQALRDGASGTTAKPKPAQKMDIPGAESLAEQRAL